MTKKISTKNARLEGAMLIVAGTLGTLAVALLSGACVARFAPLADDQRFLVGFVGVIPLWLTLAMLAFRGHSGVRTFLWCVAASAILGAVLSAGA